MNTDSVRDGKTDYPPVATKIAWFKVDYSNDKTVSHRESKILYHFKCETSEMKFVQWIDYGANGMVTNSDAVTSSTYRAAAPDTVGYSMLDAACYSKFN